MYVKGLYKKVLTAVLCSFIYMAANAQIQFMPNKGQWPANISARASLNNGNLWLCDSGLLFSFAEQGLSEKIHDRGVHTMKFQRNAFCLVFEKADFSRPEFTGVESQEYYNYFIGNDPQHWVSGLRSHTEMRFRQIYPGVDMHIFSENGNIKYNLECASVAAIAQVKFKYAGAETVDVGLNKIDFSSNLMSVSEIMPRINTINGSNEETLTGKYVSQNGFVSVELTSLPAQDFEKIIIDPILVFSTYTGSRADNFGCTGTYNENGNGFSGGTVFALGLPVTLGTYQSTFGGGAKENLGYGDGRDAAILKFTPDGSSLIYCTYLGGSNNEQPHSMVVNENDELFVMGSTRSTNFPVSIDAADKSHNGDYDFFVSKFSADGKSLLGSTFIGGSGMDAVGANRELISIDSFPLLYNYADEFRGEIIADEANVYVCGVTFSTAFPRSNNSAWYGGKSDGCVFSLNASLSSLNWSQLVGSNGNDAFYGLALGKDKDLYVSGGTTSVNLPNRISGFRNTYLGGLADGLVVRLNKNSGKLLSASYLGTAQYDQAYFAQTDNSGDPYFFGHTEGRFPKINAEFYQQDRGQFIVRMDTGLNSLTLSTSFGANNSRPNISPSAFLVDQCERIFISGWGGETNDVLYDLFTGRVKSHVNTGSTFNLPVSKDAYQSKTDGSDFYIAIFSKEIQSLQYATFFGGISNSSKDAHEHVDGGTSRFDKRGIIYQSVCAGCGRNGLFPTTPGAYSRTNNSTNCNNALFKLDFENLNNPPVMNDTFIEVMATDMINFMLTATDKDKYDSVDLDWQYIQSAGSAAGGLFIQKGKGQGAARFSFQWFTNCKSWSKDTFVLRVRIFDKGCPTADTTYAYIKILVNEPPKVIPPDALCVSFDRVTKDLKISWPSSVQDSRFFDYFNLYRVNPDGSRVLLKKVSNTNAGEFLDLGLVNPELNNYCYVFEGVNTCGVVVGNSGQYCTMRELNNPIPGVEVLTATVENDRRVKVNWTKTDDPDFYNYEIYRYDRNSTAEDVPFAYTTDTFFYDSSFNVDNRSYCYAIRVTDKCGHISSLSNPGCNVVIRGSAVGRPEYYFTLNWQDYQGWAQGVNSWELERKYRDVPWTVIANTSTNNRSEIDRKLDFDWGGYWYRVTATEENKSNNRLPQKSESNWIYLYQPPELYVPSGITVNGDNLNDVWGTVPVFVRTYSMKVYNRWGEKIWESDDKKKQWDGTVNGQQVRDGVFAWYVIFDGWDDKTYKMTGTVTIIH